MIKFKIYRRRYLETGNKEYPRVEMVPYMTISAKTAEAALRIAKQKGEVAPIVGPDREVPHGRF